MSKKKLYDEDGNVVEGAKIKKPFYKRWWFIALIVIVVFIAIGSGGDDSETSEATDNADSAEQTTEVSNEAEETEDEAEDESNNDLHEFNEVVVDNENFKATLLDIEYIYDDMWDEEKIEVRFDIENKRDDGIEVQARSVSLNDRMVDESLQSMSQEVAAGKTAEAVLDIQDYEGNELPALEGNFEMLLHVFSWDDVDYTEDAEVSVSLD
jgi:hypothetical protein